MGGSSLFCTFFYSIKPWKPILCLIYSLYRLDKMENFLKIKAESKFGNKSHIFISYM